MSNELQKLTPQERLKIILPAPAKDLDNVRFALGSFQRSISASLPPGSVSLNRICSGLLNEIRRNPALLQCTTISLVGFVLQAAQFGLEVGGILGQCYAVPYGKEAQFQVGYRGYLTLASRCPQIRSLTAGDVYEGDTINIDLGTAKEVVHKPNLKSRGEIMGVYAILEFANSRDIRWMTKEQLLAHRAKYVRAGHGKTPWDDPLAFPEMGMKTVIRKAAKACPVSLELTKAANLDILGEETNEPQNLSAEVQIDDADPEAVEDRKTTIAPPVQKKADKVNQQLFDNNKAKVDPKDRAEN